MDKQKEFEKRLVARLQNQPEIKRFMRKVVLEMGYDVSKFSKLVTKYYASLLAFELQVAKGLGMNPQETLKMIENGKIDAITETKLNEFLKKNNIDIPSDLVNYSGLGTLLVQLGQKEYNLSERNRKLKGLETNSQSLVDGGVSDSVANELKSRRDYILEYRDEQQFIGKAIKKLATARRENKEERKDKRTERKLAKIEARQSAKTERQALRSGSDQGGVLGQLGGTLGDIFGGGGQIPQYEDPNIYDSASYDLGRNISDSTKDGKDKRKDLLIYGGLSIGIIVILKVFKVF